MSITLIAMAGILAGFLCLVVGFLMGDTKKSPTVEATSAKRVKTIRKRIVLPRRKAA